MSASGEPMCAGHGRPRVDAALADTTWDTIVIGSGIGGLTAASLLAQLGDQRVLVLERHRTLGGFTHTFRRPGGLEWDVGLHYVGGMGEGAQSRQLMDLVTEGGVRWAPMPWQYDCFEYPGLRVAACGGDDPDAELVRMFPEDAAGIRRVRRDIRRAAHWYGIESWARAVPGWMAPLVRVAAGPWRRLATATTGTVIARHVRTPAVRAALASAWSDYGVPPARSAFGVHAVVSHSYEGGAFYPAGGASSIARAILRPIERAGGRCVANIEVTGIVVERGCAVGVQVRRSRRSASPHDAPPILLRARQVVSDAGARATYTRLLPEGARPAWWRTLDATPTGLSAVVLFLSLRASPATVGLAGENRWFARRVEHDADARVETEALLDGHATRAYLSVGSLRDPSHAASVDAPHTAQVLTWVHPEAFARWRDTAWRRRGADYEATKVRITRALLALVEAHVPGFRALVDHTELATPLTIEHFSGHAGGACYGDPATPRRLRAPWIGARTPVARLWLAGADACSPGIVGSMMGGVFAAGGVLGPLGFVRILRVAARGVAASRTPASVARHADSTPVPDGYAPSWSAAAGPPSDASGAGHAETGRRHHAVVSTLMALALAGAGLASVPRLAAQVGVPPADPVHGIARAVAASGSLRVRVDGIAPIEGRVRIALFRAEAEVGGRRPSPPGWPRDQDKALRRVEVAVTDTGVEADFRGLPAGTYAIAVHHDADGSRIIHEGPFGIPRDGWAMSNDPRPRWRAPSFGEAAFVLGIDEHRAITMRMKY